VAHLGINKQQRTVRLPKLDVIKFNEKKTACPAFWEQYNVAIRNNNDVDELTKYTKYLKTLITGRAAAAIAGLSQSEVLYNDAIELLKSDYADTDSIVNNYIEEIIAISAAKHEKDSVAKNSI
ncbi:hypothetical protein Trydic_g13474, partial [Trypoxylus dichotomus]